MVSFEWSSPVRRVRGRMLSPIPLEVYLEIYTYLEPSQELSRAESNVILSKLAKVCRFFGAHSLSRLYRTLDLSGEDAGSSGHSAFCGLLVKSTAYKNAGKPLTSNMEMALQLASFVKECTFRDWLPSDRLIPMADAFLLRNARAVRLTKNVNKIYISATPLTNPLVQTVYNLKATLSTLSIRNCPLEIELTQHQQNHLSNLKLASLEFLSPSSSPFDIPPETLRLKDLREFITDSGRLSDHFLRRPHPFLRRLELQDVQDLPLLFARLDKCPTITELTINNVMRPLGGGPPKIPALAATALPDLETLSIPTILLDSCMRRTVRKLSILGAQREYNGPGAAGLDGVGFLFPTLALLTAEKVTALVKKDHLTELHIPQHLYFDIPLHKQLPQLEKLVLSWCHPNFPEIEPAPVVPVLFPWQRSPSPTPHINAHTIITSLCKQWPAGALSKLRELRLQLTADGNLDGVSRDVREERELITQHLSVTFPRLVLFTRTPAFIWERIPEDVQWRVFIPPEYTEIVRGLCLFNVSDTMNSQVNNLEQ